MQIGSLVLGVAQLIKIHEAKTGESCDYIYMSPGMYHAWSLDLSNIWSYDEAFASLQDIIRRNMVITEKANAYGTITSSGPLEFEKRKQ